MTIWEELKAEIDLTPDDGNIWVSKENAVRIYEGYLALKDLHNIIRRNHARDIQKLTNR